MQAMIPVILFLWIPTVVFLCWLLPPRTGVLASVMFAIMFLPVTNLSDADSHHITKLTSTALGVLIASLCFHSGILFRFRLRWFDLPAVVWSLAPFFSSIANDQGAYNGFWDMYGIVTTWTVPYFIGRVYFSGLFGLRQLLTGIFIGGLVYVPFCLFEMRMSPQLHRIFYGFHQHDFSQTYRWGGWRPMVFMDHGLMVGMWMSMAALAGCWLWWTGVRKRLFGYRIEIFVVGQLLVAVACKSLGALLLMGIGLVLLWASWTLRVRWVIAFIAILVPAYLTFRLHSDMSSLTALQKYQPDFSSERGGSLIFRLQNEQLILAKALQQPWFGWSGFDRGSVFDEFGKKISISDSLWIVTLSTYGMVGVMSVFAMQLLPPLVYLYRRSNLPWRSRLRAPALGLAMIVLLYSLDNLFNAMINPMFIIAAGGIAGCRPLRVSQTRIQLAAQADRAIEPEATPALAVTC